jgi:glutaredoxin-dependent peroxiredoxin
VRVVGVSRDSPYSHIEWAKRLGLDYPLLSDWNGEAVRAFGVAQDLDGLLDTPQRACFVIDAGGVVRFAKRYAGSEVPDAEELVAAARALAG